MIAAANGSDLSLAQLERMLVKRRRELALMMRRRAAVERRLHALTEQIRLIGGTLGGGAKRAKNAISLIEAIEQVFCEAKNPLSVEEIYKNVLALGYRSTSPNFRAIVNQTLIKERRFQSARRGVYQLKK